MSLREQLHAYIAQLEKRLRWSIALRGLAILTGSALIATLVLVTIANARAFSEGSVTAARFALFLILAVAAGAGLILPLRRLTRRRAVGTAEIAFPQFEQRLVTFTERDGRDPFIELLAGETLEVAQSAEPKELVTDRRLWISLATSVGAFAVLVWMIVAGPGFLGYGASLLWTGPRRPALYDLRVIPGDAVVRRQADQLISALPTGMQSPSVKLYARFESSSKWEQIAMQPAMVGDFAGGYQFLFAALPENVEYYVTAGAMTSKHYNIRVTDLPAVKQIRVTYHYPAWTGMPSETEERGGDLRAVTGTEAELEISTDRPLQSGEIQLDGGQKVALVNTGAGQNNVYRATVKMDQDGVYHVAGVDQGKPVRISEDFFIEARKPNPPQIALVRPGHGDYHASPIEEVTVAAKASGDYALKDVELHYSVNGGAETTVDLLKKKGEKQTEGSTTLSLEQFKMIPGDLISVYATARDANAESHTDMLFIQADPFEREYSQSQMSGGGGGGGGGGDPSAQISQREKEIISQTFKQQADKNATAQQSADISKLLSESQATLRDQAVSLAGRLEARELTGAVQAISDFQKDMLAASGAMQPAAQQLQQQKWKDAIPNEQKALQFLLRAEATFRQIQVAFGGGGGGGGGGAARDLAQLFDLELDTEKNQYETGQNQSATAEQREKEIEDALKKLDELAKREENLAQQQRNPAQTAEQKWQQEMLRRDAEQLQQQLEQQLGQNGQQGQQSQSGGKSGSSSTSSGSASSSGSQASGRSGNSRQSSQQPSQSSDAREQAAQRALDRLHQAVDDMKRAGSQSASAADARRAADRLREATDLLGGLEQQDAASRLKSMAQVAEQLTARQKQQADHVRDLIAQQNAARAGGKQQSYPSAQEIDKMVEDRQKVADDLARLTQQMRGAARELAPTQPAASSRLRSALDGADENDLNTRMQRSSDWLRSGRFSDQAESALTNDLQKLGQGIGDAARALGGAQLASKDAEINRAMDDLSRLRDQLAGLGRAPGRGSNPQAGQQGQAGRAGQQFQQNGQLGRGGNSGQAGPQAGSQAGSQGGTRDQAGRMGDRIAGAAGNPAGGNRSSTLYGDLDTGNTRIQGRAVAPQQGPNPADAQREIDQGLNLLNQLRSTVQESPEARQQLQALVDEMRSLDPKRFPGNPALVEQMRQQLVSGVDALELQLRRQLDENRGGTIRNADPEKVPAGYQESVAEYYRKLSGGNH